MSKPEVHNRLGRVDDMIAPMTDATDGDIPRMEEDNGTREQLHQQREALMQQTTTKFESALEQIKAIANNMLTEVDAYMSTSEKVLYNYERVLASQQMEAQRISSMEPDVTGATERFLHPAEPTSMMRNATNAAP